MWRCARGQSILAALAPVHHRHIAAGCFGGGCGVCKIRIVSGDYEAALMSAAHVSGDDRVHGIALACRTYLRSDAVIEVLGKVPRALVRKFGFLVVPEPPAD